MKNRQRWTFGGLYPPSVLRRAGPATPRACRRECLVAGGRQDTVSRRRSASCTCGAGGSASSIRPELLAGRTSRPRSAPSSRSGSARRSSTPGRRRRSARSPLGRDRRSATLAARPQLVDLRLPARRAASRCATRPGRSSASSSREREAIAGDRRGRGAEAVGEGLFRVTVRVANRTPLEDARPDDRDEALLHALVSTHTILGVDDGEFVSLLDPPEPCASWRPSCRNVGTWPVLVGDEGETDTMLSSPIILYDYPADRAREPGRPLRRTEIDEILTLRIMTLTDEEKRTMAAVDPRGRHCWSGPRRWRASSSWGCTARSAESSGPSLGEAESWITGTRARGRPAAAEHPRRRRRVPGGRPRPALAARARRHHGPGPGRQDRDHRGDRAGLRGPGPPRRHRGRRPRPRPRRVRQARPPLLLPARGGRAARRRSGEAAHDARGSSIAGIGNIFLGDDAFGVEVARRLAGRPLPEGVRVVDFGIRGFDLAYALLDDAHDVAILVDAAPRGEPPGTLYVIEPDWDEAEAIGLARRRRSRPTRSIRSRSFGWSSRSAAGPGACCWSAASRAHFR